MPDKIRLIDKRNQTVAYEAIPPQASMPNVIIWCNRTFMLWTYRKPVKWNPNVDPETDRDHLTTYKECTRVDIPEALHFTRPPSG